MKVILLTSIAGKNFSAGYGDEVDLPEQQVIDYMAAGVPLCKPLEKLTKKQEDAIAKIKKERAEAAAERNAKGPKVVEAKSEDDGSEGEPADSEGSDESELAEG